ncbi:rhomboid family intramembrane serine protease [Amphibiibacter pelophylacis]|uniref:Rhomboid family intramembrane serine protease n=1 Tax=Amphibiibacter pelophylacis TaxID=1799477 RepID=A0ACC6P3I4_9BURK
MNTSIDPNLLPVYVVIAVTVLITWWGWRDRDFINRYCFHVGAIRHGGQWARLLVSGFLHADLAHLLFNMITLYFFGGLTVKVFGVQGFAAMYLGSLLLANVLTLALYWKRTSYAALGASGAVSGVLFATLALFPHIGIYLFFVPIPVAGWVFAVLYMAYTIFAILRPEYGGNIGHAAHLGGALTGVAMAAALQPQQAGENLPYIGLMLVPVAVLAVVLWRRR